MASTLQLPLQPTRAKILIVEDEALIAESLSSTLSRLGYIITGIADSYEQTLAEILKNKPDCILMDVRIPGEIDGIEATTKLRELYDTPVIYLTGQTDSATIRRAKMTMPSGFLPKPVHSITLSATIEMAVHKHQAIQAHERELGHAAKGPIALKSLTEVSERKHAEEKLCRSEQRLRSLVEGIKDYALLMLDPQGLVSSWTRTATEIKGYKAEEILGQSFARFYTPEDVERGHPEEVLCIAREVGHFEEEGWRVRKDGSRFWADVMITAMHDDAGEVTGFSKMTRDSTERHKFRKERDRLIANLEQALKEKTILLQEVHHRVKNSLAVVAAFLRMQATAAADEHLTPLLEKSQQRVASMALVHEYLYSSEHLNEISFGKYVTELASELCVSYAISDRVHYIVETDNIELSIESAIPCGLILNELLSNALKYGFPGKRHGTVTVRFCRLKSGELSLMCHDDGIGFPEKLDWENASSLGLKIVKVLAKQVKGTLSLDRSDGTRFELTFPEVTGTALPTTDALRARI